MWGTPVLLLSLLAAPAADPPTHCTLAGRLTFTPALADAPAPVTATLTGRAAECTDHQLAYADVTVSLSGQAGGRTARLSGTATYTWHLRSGDTATSTQSIAGIGIGTAYAFEGTITKGRYTGQSIEITPLVPPSRPPGPTTTLDLLDRLTIHP